MALSSELPIFDYVITDSNGMVGVKDGVKTPISKEAWEKAHPEHRMIECKECTFVADTETLLTFHVARELRGAASGKPVFVGKFTMPGWSGHSGFYLFKCPDCEEVHVDYPHGYCENGCLYLRCAHCRFQIVLTPRKYKDIYQREQVVSPPSFLQELSGLWIARKQLKELRRTAGEIEDKHGVRVLVNGEATQVVTRSRFNIWNVGLILLALYTIGIALFTHPNWRPF